MTLDTVTLHYELNDLRYLIQKLQSQPTDKAWRQVYLLLECIQKRAGVEK